MAFQMARILEVIQIGDFIGANLALPTKLLPSPGQYLPGQNLEDPAEILHQPLFRVIGPDDRNFLGPIPRNWQPGDKIGILSPQGNGFQLPPSARRVGLLAMKGQALHILPLVKKALKQDASLVLFFQEQPHPGIQDWIPPNVEISPISVLQENLNWPDFMAVELAREDLKSLSVLLGDNAPSFTGQVLVKTAMPCRRIGKCGVCAIKTRHGWRYACEDGPVFPLKELPHVAG